ncbi:MAG: helix-turn-helix domain-containing protein [Muribaculaceae bacterium]|nr:helix-turn-helix domain-containing protein [Muribaculaceae bacterium]MCM1479776.1 helix-turn-helix domain-containing protein [Muribaculaceae bacterium]
MDITKDVFGERLTEIRKEHCETQQELADSIGITQQSLCRYEQGERTANIEFIKKVAEHFNVSADYLLGLSDVRSYDADLNAVCKYTGLNEQAVTVLSKCNKDFGKHIDVINSLISEGYFHDLARRLTLFKSPENEEQKKYSKYDFMEFMVNLVNIYVRK